MIRALFFDFDRCLFDTQSMGTEFLEPTLTLLEESALSQDIKDDFKHRMHETDFDEALRTLEIPEELSSRMRASYASTTPPHGVAYEDVHVLSELPEIKILVTSGFRKFQEQKIANAGIAQYFDNIIIDSFDDGEARKGKQKIFEELLELYHLAPHEVLVVGDKPSSELAAGKALGMIAVQIVRPGTTPWNDAEHSIHSLTELQRFLSERHEK